MKHSYWILLLLILCCGIVHGQAYGDEWIDYNKQYYKVSLAQNGIYRISYADLSNSGFPVNSVDPRRIQLYYKGVEQAVYVQGQGDAIFNTTDFIEFYGLKNDGKADAELYKPTSAQPHQFYSIYSDTSAYFLTYNLSPVNGKRMTSYSENNVGGLLPSTSHTQEILLLNVSQYSPGQGYSTKDFTKYSYFDYGEGWTSPYKQENEFSDFVLTNIVQGVTSVGTPSLEVLLVGRDDLPHNISISVGQNTASLRTLGTVQFDNYESSLFTSSLLWTDISVSGTLTVRVSVLGVSGGNDRASTSYIRVFFPQNFDMQSANSKTFYLKADINNKSYVESQNAPPSVQLYDITDTNNVIRIGSNQSGTNVNAIVNGTGVARSLFINGSNFITPVITKSHFRSINAALHDYIIISHKLLKRPIAGSTNPVKSYSDYRASDAGGAFDTLTVYMDMLYDQYNHGIKNPLAIFNFMRYMVNNGDPKYLLLLGKGLEPSVNFHRKSAGYIPFTRQGVSYEARDLVMSAGNPGSDMSFTAGLNGTTYEPAVPVGRIPALTGVQILAYLNKVIQMEAVPFDKLWRKNLLHLSGGATSWELQTFRSYMTGFASIAEGNYLGGNVETVAKSSGSILELINVADEVNKGLSLITFFGHSAPNFPDIDIGYVTDPVLGYSNTSKYPMFLINGCNAGQFFNPDFNFGEDWILADNKGALGFIAHSSYGFTGNLRKYSELFYNVGYGDSVFISMPIGDVQKEVAKRYMSTSANSANNITQVQQMNLIGDPAVNLFGPTLPDYELTNENLYIESFNDKPVTALSDSFAIKIIVKNFGRTRKDSIRVTVLRTLQDNSQITYDSMFANVYYQDTLTYSIKRGEENGFGNNKFEVQLDSDFSIPELNENNNTGTFDFFIPLFGTRNLFPTNYSIVSEQPVELLAQSTNILEDSREFIFQLDTVKTFDSPYLKQNSVTAKLLATWSLNLLPDVTSNDSTVYFWRTKYGLIEAGESDEWVVSSFTYIKNSSTGWSQGTFTQFDENGINGLIRKSNLKKFEFLRTTRDIQITTFGSDYLANELDISVLIDGTEYNIENGKISRCRDNTINLIAFDKNTAIPYASIPLGLLDNKTCGRKPQIINSFSFADLEDGTDDILTYVDNLKLGDSVIMYTIGDPQLASWSTTVRNKLEEIGALTSSLSTLQNGEPFFLLGKKGAAPGSAEEIRAMDIPITEQQLQLTKTVSGVVSKGTITSTLIGPSASWGVLMGRVDDLEIPLNDIYFIDIIGVNLDGSEAILFPNIDTFPFDLSTINTASYPYIKLVLHLEDDINLTPGQLDKWHVIYTPEAEGIVIASKDNIEPITLQEGETVQRTFGFKNISKQSFSDSLTVYQQQVNANSRKITSSVFKIMAPEPGDTTLFNIKINSLGAVGDNDLNINVNPKIIPEIYYDNNVLDLSRFVNVKRDNVNPLLDVLFDGRYILNGDIVSPTPFISIKLKDENPFIKVVDTTQMNIFMKQECENCNFKRVSFSSQEVQWFAANEKQDFSVEYKPEKLDDGIYTLRLEGSDVSGNLSGTEPYLISFEVINESSVTHFYPYPNPFSTSTRFIYTLTGSEIPQEIKIQIMTVSGKIVREITQNELGIVRIGNNISDYAWDGRDEFGDQLANGVYLYRVIIRQNGETIKQRSTSADKAFTKGFGKLYILK
jgi:hypothetical protein